MQSVTMVDYDPEWPTRFRELRDRIAAALGGLAITIEHVGSTSVPNMCAKPIIDLDVVVRSEDVPAAISAVEALGYRHEGNLGVAGREAFRWVGDFPEHHLYVCPEGSPALERHLLIRDYLRKHPDVAREYAVLKKQLAQKYRGNRTKYQAAKSEFVDAMLEKARAEFGR
ncbi:MAG TPA: GrpB family protein [Candidatus Acidoferrales bacterium]|nr:GrpB family protein [Candidatus Acidoferrales bacterium]